MTIKIDGDRHFLRHWRQAKGLTQGDLASRAATVKSEISRLERGSRKMTLEWMSRLTQAMGISREDLMVPPPPGPTVGSSSRMEGRFAINEKASAMLGEISLAVRGESFELTTFSGDDWPGVFTPGDILILDKRKTGTSVPGVYAVKAGDEIVIRRITTVGGEVILSCKNPAYLPTSLLEGMVVAGRVAGHIRRM